MKSDTKSSGTSWSPSPQSDLSDYLLQVEIPLTRNAWAAIRRGLEARKLDTLYCLRSASVKRDVDQSDLDTRSDTTLLKKVLTLALVQNRILRSRLAGHNDVVKRMCRGPLIRGRLLDALPGQKNRRERKPDRLSVGHNWLTPMPVFNEREPYGYVQSTGQSRKRIEAFLHSIGAKPVGTLGKKNKGRPNYRYGIETNCRVLDAWLGQWSDQEPETKGRRVFREAFILARVVTDSKAPVQNEDWAKVRKILLGHARDAASRVGVDSDFRRMPDLLRGFLASPAACAAEIKRLRREDLRRTIEADIARATGRLPSQTP